MRTLLNDFARAMVELNATVAGHGNNNNRYAPGIGPYGEDHIVNKVMQMISEHQPGQYGKYYVRPVSQEKEELGLSNYMGLTGRPATPDLVTGNKIIEFKIARPLRNNENREDTWFKKVFEPNPDSYSIFIDVEKLSIFSERFDAEGKFEKWVVVIGFERLDEQEYKLDLLFPGLFKYISEEIRNRKVKEFFSSTSILGERHPFHQVVKLYAFKY
jgi:hypothetical protein